MSFIYCHLNVDANLSRPWRFIDVDSYKSYKTGQ